MNVRELGFLLAICKRIVPDFARKAAPLSIMSHEGAPIYLVMEEESHTALSGLKHRTEPSILDLRKNDQPSMIETDVYNIQVGASSDNLLPTEKIHVQRSTSPGHSMMLITSSIQPITNVTSLCGPYFY